MGVFNERILSVRKGKYFLVAYNCSNKICLNVACVCTIHVPLHKIAKKTVYIVLLKGKHKIYQHACNGFL